MPLKKYRLKNNLSQSIEAEEIFLDAEAVRSIEDKGKMEKPIKERAFKLFYIVIVLGLIGLFFRAGYLEIIKGRHYSGLAEGNKLKSIVTAAPRGIIYDRNMRRLVYNEPSFDLIVNLADFFANKQETQDQTLQKISEIISISKDQLWQRIDQVKSQMGFLILEESIEYSKALIIETLVENWSGFRLEKNAKRDYVFSQQFAHIIGYTGRMSSQDLKEHSDYLFSDFIGKDGLELKYDKILRGQTGKEQVEVDSLGKIKRVLEIKDSLPGQGLVLNIDAGLQEQLFKSMSEQLKQLRLTKAAAAAVDPRNGAVLAAVSLPSFDSNLFCQQISTEQYQALCQDSSQPLFNRVIAGQYPPGSIIKPLIASAALQEKVISSSKQINCQGSLNVVSEYNPEVVYQFMDWNTHGFTDIIKAIAESCDIYFYTVGGGFGSIDGLGIDRIKKYLQLFGLGQATGIDLVNEEKGLVPDKAWKKQDKNEAWYIGDTYHVSIGQGDLLVTPIQMAMAISAIANNGILYQPQIVDKIVDAEKNQIEDIQPQIIQKDFIDKENLSVVQKGMRQAVTNGSAWALTDFLIPTAGKTGTAQFGSENKTHAWYVGYAPYQNPEIVIVVLIEEGGEGSRTAAPVVKDAFNWWFNENKIINK